VPEKKKKKKTENAPLGSLEDGKPSAKKMVYETSAGGVVLRHIRGTWQVAIIEPNIINADTTSRRNKARPEGTVFALPKGGVDDGETPEQSADREVFEETGIRGRLLFRLTTIRYLYQRSWGGREHVSKAVSFYLFVYHSGRLGQISPDMRDEVRKAFWFPLDKAHRKLTYRGEREVLKMAQKIVREQPERLNPPPPQLPSGPNVVRPVAQQRSASQRFVSPSRAQAQARNPSQARARSASAGQSRGSAAGSHPRNAASDKRDGKAAGKPDGRSGHDGNRSARQARASSNESSAKSES